MLFWLGTHEPHWTRRTLWPLFLSARRLRLRKGVWPRSFCSVAIDSGGFSELSLFGRWQTPAKQYADEVRRWSDELGTVSWAAIQDWMCEPAIVAKTGLSVAEHQRRTVDSWHELHRLAPDVRWVAVLQGWHYDDYFRHLEMYRESGVDLRTHARVGLGSVCRRQDTVMAEQLIEDLARRGLRLHGFGFKFGGVVRSAKFLHSADSMAWSLNARKNPPRPGCTHRSCANCLTHALAWRERLLAAVEVGRKRVREPELFAPPLDAASL